METQYWERVSRKPEPSWYLDPVTAVQKREAHLRLIREWSRGVSADRILKTDLFEEAFGEDSLLDSLFPGAELRCGMDASFGTASGAFRRYPQKIRAFTCDVRNLAARDGVFDVIISNSTLDHFMERASFLRALSELSRTLKPGGVLIITLDNPWNPLYPPLRWLSRLRNAPFRLGYTESAPRLKKDLASLGLIPEKTEWLLHNPRGLSTLLILGLRKLLPRKTADIGIRLLLNTCAQLNKLPTRKLTACFVAVSARKSRFT